MPKIWRFMPHDQARIRQLSRELNISFLLSQVLVARGMSSPADAAAFLEAKLTNLHDPDDRELFGGWRDLPG